MNERTVTTRGGLNFDGPFTCAFCGRKVRSIYSIPGEPADTGFCSTCFFGDPETTFEPGQEPTS